MNKIFSLKNKDLIEHKLSMNNQVRDSDLSEPLVVYQSTLEDSVHHKTKIIHSNNWNI